jgi:acetylornithine/N-succinyldiaminopimelate aminotransferase
MPHAKHNQISTESKNLVDTGYKYFVPNYKPREMILDHGKGAKLWDKDGFEYIDLGSGIAVNSLGHQHPKLVEALTTQAKKLWHTSNVFFTEPTVTLAKEMVEASNFAKRIFFCNSGAEANEAAIKLARKYASDNGRPPEAREIVTFKGSFHGRTLATVTATAQPKYQQGYEPLPGGFVYAEAYNDTAAVDKAVSEKTCAILVEPHQGEGGIIPFKPGFLAYLRKKCDEVGALLMLDQVQCGMMRTGKLFSHWHEEGLKPDTVSLAKALGCGFPIGALLVGEKASEVLQFGSHGTTFGGNPMATAVAGAALKILQTKELQDNVAARSKQLFAALEAFNKELNIFVDIRGRGLMIGAELKPELHNKANDIVELARQYGVLILNAGPNVLRFLPPLNITEAELAEGMDRLGDGLREYVSKQ